MCRGSVDGWAAVTDGVLGGADGDADGGADGSTDSGADGDPNCIPNRRANLLSDHRAHRSPNAQAICGANGGPNADTDIVTDGHRLPRGLAWLVRVHKELWLRHSHAALHGASAAVRHR